MVSCGGAPDTLEAVVQIFRVWHLHALDKQGVTKFLYLVSDTDVWVGCWKLTMHDLNVTLLQDW